MGRAIFKPLHHITGITLPTVTVHAGNRFKAMTDSGTALLLVHTKFYSMIEDPCGTKILPAAVHLKTADGSAKSSLCKASLHLSITNIKFSHICVICDKIPWYDPVPIFFVYVYVTYYYITQIVMWYNFTLMHEWSWLHIVTLLLWCFLLAIIFLDSLLPECYYEAISLDVLLVNHHIQRIQPS